jgi:phospholipid/cholesterol/gamma-HCH transport system permease protein
MAGEPAAFAMREEDGRQVLAVAGDWTIGTIGVIDAALREARAEAPAGGRALDVSALGDLDTAGAFVLWASLGLSEGATPDLRGDHPTVGRLLTEVARHAGHCGHQAPSPGGFDRLLARIGEGVVDVAREAVDTLSFVGETVVALGRAVVKPHRVRWIPTFAVAESAGVNAIPIVMTLSFFIGAVVAFMGATILRDFGATIFTVELVGFSVLREFGALITAIILAGRSDSSFTAQIGAMKMTQEIDAMRVLGLDPIEMLVVPRVLALVVMVPILTFLAMLSGLLGGGLVAMGQLDLSPVMFLTRIQENVGVDQFWAGMAKAPVFALIIAIIGCRQGLTVKNDVISLGRNTTTSVVQALFMVIIVEAIFALIYMELDI